MRHVLNLLDTRSRARDERGQVIVMVALMFFVFMGFGGIVIGAGNWFTHAKHLQTKVDAGALAGGQAWGFPCGPDSDTNALGVGIVDVARQYVGPHTTAGGTVLTGGYNAQVGGVDADDVHVVINADQWWDDDAGQNPADTSGTGLGPSVCEAMILDVKATEANSFPLFSLLPVFPDLKRKARIEIQEANGVTGLLPIAVRIPRPLSAAAVFYNEAAERLGSPSILAVRYLRQVCTPPAFVGCIPDAPAGLGQWTTEPAPASGDMLAQFNVAGATGVVIASSFRPACNVPGATAPCLDDSPSPAPTTATEFCRQNATVTCWDATGSGTTQTVQAGVHFMQGYPAGNVPDGPNLPEVRRATLGNADCPANGYFNSANASCLVQLNVEVDVGSCLRGPGQCFPDPGVTPPEETRVAGSPQNNVQVRYCLVTSTDTGNACDSQFSEDEDLNCSGGPGMVSCSTTAATHPRIAVASRENAFAIEVRLRNTRVTGFPECQDPGDFKDNCRWFFVGTGNFGDSVAPIALQVLRAPIQRSFMGYLDRTGPLEWLQLRHDVDCDPDTGDWIIGHNPVTGEDAASHPINSNRCFILDMGLEGGMARDQDEPPVALLLGAGSSQRALVDCDPNIPFGQVSQEIQFGCQWPAYTGNKFEGAPNQWCPYGDQTPGSFFILPKPAPFDDWEPFDCVLTRTTTSASQIEQGFNQRFFGVNNSPQCPTDDASPYQRGRNYWHRVNNSNQTYGFAWDGDGNVAQARGTRFHDDDPRAVNLFLTPYGSFTGSGTQVQELVGLGNFYITGYGRFTGSGLVIEDPCSDGSSSPVYPYAGNDPPPDIPNGGPGQRVIWGHFIKDVPGGTRGGTGERCQPLLSFNPCVPVLIE